LARGSGDHLVNSQLKRKRQDQAKASSGPGDTSSHDPCQEKWLGPESSTCSGQQGQPLLSTISINDTGCLVFWLSAEGKIIEVNQTACEKLRLSRAQLLSMSAADLTPDFAAERWQNFWPALTRQGSIRFDSALSTETNKTMDCELFARYITHDEEYFACLFAHDALGKYAAKKRLKLEKQKASKAKQEVIDVLNQSAELALAAETATLAKKEFMANVTHELKTPLNGITGMVNLLLDSDLTEMQKEFAEAIEQCTGNLSNTVENLVNFSATEDGSMALKNKLFNFPDFLNEIILRFSDLAKRKNLTFTHEISSNVPQVVSADSEFLGLLIGNLLDNAIKFTDTGLVSLVVEQVNEESPQAQITFSIQDSGIGMESGQIEEMFSAFSQMDGSSTRKYGGVGLGLTLSKRLADLMGGSIDVESQHGTGSTFIFSTALQVPSQEENSTHESVVIDNTESQKISNSKRNEPMSNTTINPVGLNTFVAIEPVFDRDEEIINGLLKFSNSFEALYESLNWMESSAKALEFINSSPRIDDEDFISTAMALLDAEAPESLVALKPMVMIPPHLESNSTTAGICNSLADVGYNLTACEMGLAHLDNDILQCIETVVVDPAQTATQNTDSEKWTQAGVRTMTVDITSRDVFEQASSIGCSFFIGSIMKKNKAVATHETSTNKMNLLRVLNEVNRPSLSYDELAEYIRQDIEMTYKLLKFMNSAWFGFRQKISSVKHALVLLGPKEIRKWISLVVVRDIGEDQPLELLVRSLTRAKVAEQLAIMLEMNDSSCDLFLMGMLSVIDQLLGRSKGEIFAELPVTPDVKDALVNNKGTFHPIYKLILAFESGKDDEFNSLATNLRVNQNEVRKTFLQSLGWADGALKEF